MTIAKACGIKLFSHRLFDISSWRNTNWWTTFRWCRVTSETRGAYAQCSFRTARKMDHKVLTALTFHTLLVLIVAIHLSAGWKRSEPFLQKCSQNGKAEMYDVPETLRQPVEPNGQGDDANYLYRFPLLENSLGNCSNALKTLHLNTSVRGSVFWTSTGYLVTPLWSYPPERHCISRLVTPLKP